jgi:ABC-type branched-subunit amino acid transport system ATPase component
VDIKMLELENIDVRYGPIHAVKNLSLKVGSSQVVAVVGSNGAGKSSLLRAIAGA